MLAEAADVMRQTAQIAITARTNRHLDNLVRINVLLAVANITAIGVALLIFLLHR